MDFLEYMNLELNEMSKEFNCDEGVVIPSKHLKKLAKKSSSELVFIEQVRLALIKLSTHLSDGDVRRLKGVYKEFG
jgi:hypothetical protein